jgi:hypothetical protein
MRVRNVSLKISILREIQDPEGTRTAREVLITRGYLQSQ